LGSLCLSAAFFLIWFLIRRRHGRDIPAAGYQTYLDTAILILTFWLMGGPQHSFTYSATSNATFLLVMLTLIGLSWFKKRGIVIGPTAFIALVAFIIGFGTVTPFIGKFIFADVASAFGREATLSGRNEIWAVLVPFAMESPILGHGFGGFWTDAIRAMTSSHGHNGYLDMILDIGFIGLFLFAMFLLSCCVRAQRELTRNLDWGIFFLCYLLMTVLHNITESSSVGFTSDFSVILLAMAVSVRRTRSYNQGVS